MQAQIKRERRRLLITMVLVRYRRKFHYPACACKSEPFPHLLSGGNGYFCLAQAVTVTVSEGTLMAFRSIALFSEAPYHEASSANLQMKLRIVPITFAALAAASAVAMVCAQQQTPPEQVDRFQNPNLPVE